MQSCKCHSKAWLIGECEDWTPDRILNVDGFDGKKDRKVCQVVQKKERHGKN